MSDTDGAISSTAGADGGDTPALVTVTQAAVSTNDDWSNWTSSESDLHAAATGMDMVSGGHDTGDWFPSAPASGVAATALSRHDDADPLVGLPASDFTQVTDGPDDGDAAHFALSEPVSQDAALVWDAPHHPIDHSQPVDHIDWHLGGLLS